MPTTDIFSFLYLQNSYIHAFCVLGQNDPQTTVAHICHGKTYFSTAKLTFPRQNLLSHGKTYFFTAKLTFPRQNLLSHGKTYFSTAKLTFSRQNILFHGKTYFLPKIWNLERESGNGIRNPEYSESGRKAKITTESNKLNDSFSKVLLKSTINKVDKASRLIVCMYVFSYNISPTGLLISPVQNSQWR